MLHISALLNCYRRWYPNGYILFVAPTRELVEQQMEACACVCNFAKKNIGVITERMMSADRAVVWRERRVIFMTAQVRSVVLAGEILCRHVLAMWCLARLM